MSDVETNVASNGSANDQARVTLNFGSDQVGTRNFAYAKMIVRVGLTTPATNSGFASMYEVIVAQYDDGASGAPERKLTATALAEKGASGSWTPPGIGSFTFASSSTSENAFDIQNLASSTVDVDIAVIESNNIESIVITKV